MLAALMISVYHQQPCFQQAYQMLHLLMDIDTLIAQWRRMFHGQLVFSDTIHLWLCFFQKNTFYLFIARLVKSEEQEVPMASYIWLKHSSKRFMHCSLACEEFYMQPLFHS